MIKRLVNIKKMFKNKLKIIIFKIKEDRINWINKLSIEIYKKDQSKIK